jgi:hypothetical protein
VREQKAASDIVRFRVHTVSSRDLNSLQRKDEYVYFVHIYIHTYLRLQRNGSEPYGPLPPPVRMPSLWQY